MLPESLKMSGEQALRQRLRSGDEDAFVLLVRRHHHSLMALAASFVRHRGPAEEVVQETWLAVIESIDGFAGHGSLKGWIFGILADKARTRAARDRRRTGLSGLPAEPGPEKPLIDSARFNAAGHWHRPPRRWDELTPERVVAGKQLWAHAAALVDRLPAMQHAVLLLRDVAGQSPAETCALLGVTEGNQRVLLHRARARIRAALEALWRDHAKVTEAAPGGRDIEAPGPTSCCRGRSPVEPPPTTHRRLVQARLWGQR